MRDYVDRVTKFMDKREGIFVDGELVATEEQAARFWETIPKVHCGVAPKLTLWQRVRLALRDGR